MTINDTAEREIDLLALWAGITRRWLWIVLAVVVSVLAVYVWSRSQHPVYEASSSLIAAAAPSDGVVSRTLISAPPLPDGAVAQALDSSVVLNKVMATLRSDERLPERQRTQLAQDLQTQLQEGKLTSLDLTSQLDTQQNGIYTITGRAATPMLAKTLVDTVAQALLGWDSRRALGGIYKAQSSLKAQVQSIDLQLASTALPELERQTLVTTRSSTLQNLAQVSIAEQAATGTLVLVSPAVTPVFAVSPKPARNAVLAGILVFLLAAAIAALSTVLDRTVRSEDDLLELNVPTLGVIPRLRRRDILHSGMVRAARQSVLHEAVGFLRINVLGALQQSPHARVLVTSTAPGEGKSSLTAALADGFASAGQRVLILDIDLRRGSQLDIWFRYERGAQWHQLMGVGGGRNVQQALIDPANVQVMAIENGVHLLPAGPGIHDGLALLSRPNLDAVLDSWSQNYDVVLIDSAPLLAVADGLLLAPHTSGVLMIAESGKTTLQAVRRSIQRAEQTGANVIGLVINKSDLRTGDSYGYDYRPRAASESSVRG